jgi:SAM-dependent methyltransferase
LTRYMLDTNIISDLIRNPQGRAAKRIAACLWGTPTRPAMRVIGVHISREGNGMTNPTDFGGYGHIARQFDDREGQYHSPWLSEWLIENLIPHKSSAHVLDVGCGTGNFTRHLGETGIGTVCGVDPDPRMIAVAEESENSIRYHCAPTNRMPFPTGQFDGVVAHYTFENFCHDRASTDEVKRVMRPGGAFMTVTWPMGELALKRGNTIRPFATTLPPVQDQDGDMTSVGYAPLLAALGFRDVISRKQRVVIEYTIEQAFRYMLRAGLISGVPEQRIPELHKALRELCEREVDSNGKLHREIDVIADLAFAPPVFC